MYLQAIIFSACVYFVVGFQGSNSNIIRPCHLNNYDCIRMNLAANSVCKPVRGSAPAVYRVPFFRYETPHFNASYIEYNLAVIGQDRCFVSEFYFNQESDSGVLGIDCPRITFEAFRKYLQHFPLREDAIFRYNYTGTYPLIRLTTTLYNADALDFCNEFTFGYVSDLPSYTITPMDEPTESYLTTDLRDLYIYERETMFYRAKLLARMFVNSVLCDFGCY